MRRDELALVRKPAPRHKSMDALQAYFRDADLLASTKKPSSTKLRLTNTASSLINIRRLPTLILINDETTARKQGLIAAFVSVRPSGVVQAGPAA